MVDRYRLLRTASAETGSPAFAAAVSDLEDMLHIDPAQREAAFVVSKASGQRRAPGMAL